MINQGDYAAISAEKTEKSYRIDAILIGFWRLGKYCIQIHLALQFKYFFFLICFCT